MSSRWEDEDDEDYEIQDEPRKKKKRRRAGPSFLDTEAMEDENEEDDIGDEEEGDLAGLVVDDIEEEEGGGIGDRRELEAKMGSSNRRSGGSNHLASAIGNLERRFQGQDFVSGMEEEEYVGENEEDEEEDPDGRMWMDADGRGALNEKAGMLTPQQTGLRLWKVPTIRPGVEREACIQILSRFASIPQDSPQRESWRISSAFASDTVRGSIYVESPSPNHIVQSLSGIRQLLLSKDGIQMVPFNEMGDVFWMGNLQNSQMPRIGDWIRISRGLYQGDLGLVSEINDRSNTVIVRLVPRIDLSYELKALKSDPQASGRGAAAAAKRYNRSARPSPTFILLEDLDLIGIEAERVHFVTDCLRFRNHIIEESTGYLFKEAKLSQLITGDAVKPTLNEIQAFSKDHDLSSLLGGSYNGATSSAQPLQEQFDIGQRIWIKKGDLAGMSGRVIGIDGNKLRIEPYDPRTEGDGDARAVDSRGLKLSSITVEASYCAKRFDIGESVRVTGGEYDGEIGLVLKVEDNRVSILSIESNNQLVVNIEYLKSISSDIICSQGLNNLENYFIGDLVQVISTLEIGVIIKIFKTKRIEIITKDGIVSTHLHQLSGKKNLKINNALDLHNNQFGNGASVEILEGPYAKKNATVKHIWKDTIFVQIPSAVSSGGYLALDSNAVKVTSAPSSVTNETPLSPSGGGRGRGGPGGFMGFRPMSVFTRFKIVGTEVRIIGATPYKGLQGELRAIHGHEAV